MKVVGNLYIVKINGEDHIVRCTFYDEQSSDEILGERWRGKDLGKFSEKGFEPNDRRKYEN